MELPTKKIKMSPKDTRIAKQSLLKQQWTDNVEMQRVEEMSSTIGPVKMVDGDVVSVKYYIYGLSINEYYCIRCFNPEMNHN